MRLRACPPAGHGQPAPPSSSLAQSAGGCLAGEARRAMQRMAAHAARQCRCCQCCCCQCHSAAGGWQCCRLDMVSRTRHQPVVCGQGPPPPNPLVMERFQGVVSQLFQQVGGWVHVAAAPAAVQRARAASRIPPAAAVGAAPHAPARLQRRPLTPPSGSAALGPAPRGCAPTTTHAACPPTLAQRIVRLGGAVDDDMANLLVAQLLYLDSANAEKDITMYVNSPGGSVTAGEAQGGAAAHAQGQQRARARTAGRRRCSRAWHCRHGAPSAALLAGSAAAAPALQLAAARALPRPHATPRPRATPRARARPCAGMAVFDTMRHVRPDVSTCCIGMAASMGAFILASGQQVRHTRAPAQRSAAPAMPSG